VIDTVFDFMDLQRLEFFFYMMGAKKNQESQVGVLRQGPWQRALLVAENLILKTKNQEEKLASQNATHR